MRRTRDETKRHDRPSVPPRCRGRPAARRRRRVRREHVPHLVRNVRGAAAPPPLKPTRVCVHEARGASRARGAPIAIARTRRSKAVPPPHAGGGRRGGTVASLSPHTRRPGDGALTIRARAAPAMNHEDSSPGSQPRRTACAVAENDGPHGAARTSARFVRHFIKSARFAWRLLGCMWCVHICGVCSAARL